VPLIRADGSLLAGLATRTALVHPLQVPLWIDLTAVVVGALAGAGIAARERFDVIGALLLAVVMGLGGGIIRDLLLGLRPVAVTSRYYLPAVAAAALAGLLFASLLRRFGATLVILEALSAALFTVVGVEKALLYHLPYVSAIFVGVSAAVGGGVLADLISRRPVEVVHRGPWNATAALAGASVYAATAVLGARTGVSQAAGFAVVVAMRLAALCWGLQTPVPGEASHRRTAGAPPGGARPGGARPGPAPRTSPVRAARRRAARPDARPMAVLRPYQTAAISRPPA
jgi:uncharacterized membrane protein YeiH